MADAERVQKLQADAAEVLIGVAQAGGHASIELFWCELAGAITAATTGRDQEGNATPLKMPMAVMGPMGDLRELMAEPDTGAWLSAMVRAPRQGSTTSTSTTTGVPTGTRRPSSSRRRATSWILRLRTRRSSTTSQTTRAPPSTCPPGTRQQRARPTLRRRSGTQAGRRRCYRRRCRPSPPTLEVLLEDVSDVITAIAEHQLGG